MTGNKRIIPDPRRLLSIPAVYSLHSNLFGSADLKRSYVDRILQVRRGDRVLDIGCGPADILPFLGDVDYVGFDGDAAYIERARKAFGDQAQFEHRLVSAEVTDDFAPFDLAIATGVLHHLADKEAHDLFAAAFRALKPGGRLITCDGAYTSSQNPFARFLIAMDRGEHIRTPAEYEQLARLVFEAVTVEVRTDLLRVPYTHCVLYCRRPALV
jgi:SAM-dependent methyltransferase